MSGRKIGTLVVVVLKAKNLPNKRHIGKQDPYCVLKLDDQTRRTKAVKRGGQHPEWDDELRFPLYETAEEELTKTGGKSDGDAPPPPPKDGAKAKKPSKRIMHLLCYADDPREPDLIGETSVDLTEALTKGEMDEYFTLMSKQKYCGEVYLEITFWSEEEPPAKQPAPQQSALHPSYGGKGTFTPAGEVPASLQSGGYSPPGHGRLSTGAISNGRPSTGTTGRLSVGTQSTNRRESLGIPDLLRPSSSLANLNLYIPPYSSNAGPQAAVSAYPDERYAPQYGHESGYDGLGNGPPPGHYDEFGASGFGPRRRESFPPPIPGHPRQTSYGTVAPNPYGAPFSADGLASSFSTMSIGGPASAHPAGLQPSFAGVTSPQDQYYPPSGFVPPRPQATPAPSGFQQYPPAQPTYAPNQQPYIPPSSSMGFHQPPAGSVFQPPPPINSSFQNPPGAYPAQAGPYPPQPSATPAPYAPTPAPYPNYGSATPAPYPQQYPQQTPQQYAPPPPQQAPQQYAPPQQPQYQAPPPQQPQYQAPPPPQQYPPQQPYQQPPPHATNGYYNGPASQPAQTPLPPPPAQSAPPIQPSYQPQQGYAPPPPSSSAPPSAPLSNQQPWLTTPGQQNQPLPSPPRGPTPTPPGALQNPPPPPPPLMQHSSAPNVTKPLPVPGATAGQVPPPSSGSFGTVRPLPGPPMSAAPIGAPPPAPFNNYDQSYNQDHNRRSNSYPPPATTPVPQTQQQYGQQQQQGFLPPPPPPQLPFVPPPPPPPISHWR